MASNQEQIRPFGNLRRTELVQLLQLANSESDAADEAYGKAWASGHTPSQALVKRLEDALKTRDAVKAELDIRQ